MQEQSANADLQTPKSGVPSSALGVRRSSFGVWLRALRAPFFVGTLTPAAFGAAYARYSGYPFNWALFGLTMLGTALANAGCNLANDYFDHRSGDDLLARSLLIR